MLYKQPSGKNLEVMQKTIRRNEEIEHEKTIEKKVRKMTEDEKRSQSFKSAQSRKSSNNKEEEEEIINNKIDNKIENVIFWSKSTCLMVKSDSFEMFFCQSCKHNMWGFRSVAICGQFQ